MIINCLNCGIAISTKAECCPYCRVETTEIAASLGGLLSGRRKLKQKYSGTIFSLSLKS